MNDKVENTFPRWASITAGPLIMVLSMLLIVLRDRFFANESLFIGLSIGILLLTIYECVVVFIVKKAQNSDNPRKLVNTYLATKVGRVFLALLYAVIYVLAVNQEVKRFVLVFVLLYFVFLLFDTLLLTSWEKNLKKK